MAAAVVPLECNPEVMTKFLHRLGVPEKWGLVDVYGLDAELLAMLPKPCLSFILLYPLTPEVESALEKEKDESYSNDKVYHLNQYISNSCGTVALIHSVANNLDTIKLEEGPLKKFLDETKDLSSSKRGKKLAEDQDIFNAHKDFAVEGQTEAPGEEEKILNHFVAFVQVNGSIYELDGRKPGPVNHGPSSSETFVDDAARVCGEYMKRDTEEIRFSMIALAAV